MQPVTLTHYFIPALLYPRPAFWFTRSQVWSALIHIFLKKGLSRYTFVLLFNDRGAFHSGLPGGMDPGILSSVGDQNRKQYLLKI